MLGKRDIGSKVRELVQNEAYYQIVSLASQDRSVVRELISLLGDSEGWVRGSAAFALGRIGERNPQLVKEAVPCLINLLADSDRWVRGNAAEDLGWVGGEDPETVKIALPVLIRLLQDPEGWVRGNAAWSLGWIGGEDPEIVKIALPGLIMTLRDSESYVRGYAAWAMGAMGDATALPDLNQLTGDRDGAEVFLGGRWLQTTVGEIAREAIEKIAARAAPATESEPPP